MIKKQNKTVPISYYYKKTAEETPDKEVQIIDSDLKGLEKKTKTKTKTKTKKEQEEESRLITLNVTPMCHSPSEKLHG